MLYSACASAKHTSWERDGPNSAPVSEPERRGLADPRFSDTQSGDMPSLAFTAPFSRGTLRGVVPTRDFRQEIRDIAGIFLVGLPSTRPRHLMEPRIVLLYRRRKHAARSAFSTNLGTITSSPRISCRGRKLKDHSPPYLTAHRFPGSRIYGL